MEQISKNKNILPAKTQKNEHAIAIFWNKFLGRYNLKGSHFQSKTDKIDTTI